MKKNVAGQVIGAQLCSATDGSDFAGSVTVYVTGDGGTQATGSVGAGACTNEGNGFYTYSPAQAETNYDHVAFTFKGTGAITATVQVYTGFPQTVDNATNISAIKAKTDNLPADPADASDIAASFSTVNSTLATIAGYVDTEVAAVLAAVDTEVAAIKAKTDNLPASPAATGDIPTATQNADALLNRDMSAVSDTNARSPLNALRFLRNKWDISGTTLTVRKEDDSASAWTATVSTTPGADPVTGNDPA